MKYIYSILLIILSVHISKAQNEISRCDYTIERSDKLKGVGDTTFYKGNVRVWIHDMRGNYKEVIVSSKALILIDEKGYRSVFTLVPCKK